MEKYEILEQYVDISALKEGMANIEPHTAIRRWTETAIEISNTYRNQLTQIRDIYLEIPENELTNEQTLRCLNTILEQLEDAESRNTLIATELLDYRLN